MSIDISKLNNVSRIIKNGQPAVIARCPACEEQGGDTSGNHLIIFSDGRFGCVVYPANEIGCDEHRRRIFSLVGLNRSGLSPSSVFRRLRVDPPKIKKKERIIILKRKQIET